jgi:hypothetical protein
VREDAAPTPERQFVRDGHWLLLRLTPHGVRATLRCDKGGEGCKDAGGYCWLREWLECDGLDDFIEMSQKGSWSVTADGPIEIEWWSSHPDDGDVEWRPVSTTT